MKRHSFAQTLIFLAITFLAVGLACSYSGLMNPDLGLSRSDLIGTWETSYGKGITDQIQIREDGTYKQIYTNTKIDYSFETGWNEWHLEAFSDGRVWIYLEGGRYYFAGKSIGELDGGGDYIGSHPRTFWDPYDLNFTVEMVDRLVLAVRVDSKGKIILHHMWTTPDRGFAIIGGESEVFQRNDSHEP